MPWRPAGCRTPSPVKCRSRRSSAAPLRRSHAAPAGQMPCRPAGLMPYPPAGRMPWHMSMEGLLRRLDAVANGRAAASAGARGRLLYSPLARRYLRDSASRRVDFRAVDRRCEQCDSRACCSSRAPSRARRGGQRMPQPHAVHASARAWSKRAARCRSRGAHSVRCRGRGRRGANRKRVHEAQCCRSRAV